MKTNRLDCDGTWQAVQVSCSFTTKLLCKIIPYLPLGIETNSQKLTENSLKILVQTHLYYHTTTTQTKIYTD